MKTEDKYVSYKIAEQLKNLGYSRLCYSYYLDRFSELGFQIPAVDFNHPERNCHSVMNGISAPKLNDVADWLREEKGYHITIDTYYPSYVLHHKTDFKDPHYKYTIVKLIPGRRIAMGTYWKTYEEALQEGIESVLDILTNK